MNCIIITNYDQLSQDDLKVLDLQNICLDDWDYMIFFPQSILKTDEEGNLYTEVYQIDRLFNYEEDSRWSKVTFRNEEYALKIRYH